MTRSAIRRTEQLSERPLAPNAFHMVKRRADVVGLFPKEAAIVRLIGAVLLEQNDEGQLQHRSRQTEAMAERTPPASDTEFDRLSPQAA